MFSIEKRWQFAAIATDQALVSAAVAHFGYLGYAFAYVWEREGGRLRKFQQITPLALGASVATEPDAGRSAFWSPLGAISFDAGDGRLEVRAAGWSAEVHFANDARPFDAAWTISGAGHPWASSGAGRHRTRKRMGQAAEGSLVLDGRRLPLRGLGLQDWSRGHLARETAWRWAAGAGRAGDRVVGWNLRTGFDDPSEAENALWIDGEPVHLGAATIEPGPTWRVAAGPLSLTFRPDGEHREDLDLLAIASRYTQPWGVFEGTLDGAPVVGYGVVEDHWARW